MHKWVSVYSNILTLYFSDGFYRLPESAKNAASPTKPATRLLKVAGYTVVRLVGNLFQSPENPAKLNKKVWLYVVSQNNYDSLKFIADKLPDAILVAGQNKETGKYKHLVERISLRKKVLYYYKFLLLLLHFLRVKPKSTRRFFDVLYDATGFYEVYLSKLQKYKPACVVFANDHTPDARAMLLAAKALNIKTVYIQHASVSSIFPPLQFDLNLLEGQDSMEKYKMCGPISGKVELIGMPKADAYVNYRNTSKAIKAIGIGANLMDSVEEVQDVIRTLAQAFPKTKLILRPHPRDNRYFGLTTEPNNQVSISDGKQIATFDFLQEIDVLIAGNSGIHLEAVLLNVWSIYFHFNSKEALQDYYGYVANGLSVRAESKPQLIELLGKHLHQKPDVYKRAAYYNATVGTAWDGKSSELALKHLQELLQYK